MNQAHMGVTFNEIAERALEKMKAVLFNSSKIRAEMCIKVETHAMITQSVVRHFDWNVNELRRIESNDFEWLSTAS